MAEYLTQEWAPPVQLEQNPPTYGGIMPNPNPQYETSAPAAEALYAQRIFDSSAGWCYFISTAITASPGVSQTTPNHTNNLVTASHEILGS